MTPAPHPRRCKKCNVRWKNCGLKSTECSKQYPISDAELEFILQTNEKLPTDELELPVRDLIVMDIRERNPCAPHPSHTNTPAPEQQEPSSEPNWIKVFDGSDREYRLISMYELRELEGAINEDEPNHFEEMHGAGNKVIDNVRARPRSYYNDATIAKSAREQMREI